ELPLSGRSRRRPRARVREATARTRQRSRADSSALLPAQRTQNRFLPAARSEFSSAATEQVVFDDRTERADSVAPVNLFTLRVGAAVIRDRHLIYPKAKSSELCRQLRFDSEAVLFQCDSIEHLTAHHFVAGLHVAQVQIGRGVAEQGEQAIAD